MVTIKEYLQAPNPSLNITATTTQSTSSSLWEPIEGFEQWPDFEYDTLKSIFKNLINQNLSSSELPEPNKLLPGELLINSEKELEQDPIKRNILFRVNNALKSAYKLLRTKGEEKTGFDDPPFIACGAKRPIGPLTAPDWVGVSGILTPCLCGETKLSTVFRMQHLLNNENNESLHKPAEQAQHYCLLAETRYGFIISDAELVIFRIRKEELREGIARSRAPRGPTISYHSGTVSSLESSTQAMSLYSNPVNDGAPKYFQYRVIPWSATSGLTVCLALWWLTMIAYAPGLDIDIEEHYYPLDRWEKENNGYRNNTSGRVRPQLKKGDIELVPWTKAQDSDGRTYFFFDGNSTYIEQMVTTERRYYYFDHANKLTSWEKPQGLFRPYLDRLNEVRW